MDHFSGLRESGRATWWVGFALLSAMGLVWAFGIPLMASPDEPAHAIKAAAVARGDLSVRPVLHHGPYLTFPLTEVRVPAAYARLPKRFLCFGARKPVGPAQCLLATPIGSDRTLKGADTYVGAYQPTYYALVGWPSRILPPVAALRAMRVISVLISAALLASGFASVRELSRRGVLTLFAALALTPTTIFLAASINPNGMEIAAAFCLWPTVLAVLCGDGAPSGRLLLRLALAGALLATARPASPYIAVGVVVAVVLLAADRKRLAALARDGRVLGAGAVLILAIVASIVFVVVNHSTTALIEIPPSTASRAMQFRAGIAKTGTWLDELTGATGWLGYDSPRLPSFVVRCWLGVVALGVLAAVRIGTWRERSFVAALVAAVLLGPPAAVALTSTRYAWQGRYILPVAVGIPITAGWLLDRHLAGRQRNSKLASSLFGAIALGIGGGYVLAVTRTVSFTVLGHNRLRPVLDSPWPGPFSPLAFYVWAFVTAMAWSVWLLGTLAPRRARASEPANPSPWISGELRPQWGNVPAHRRVG